MTRHDSKHCTTNITAASTTTASLHVQVFRLMARQQRWSPPLPSPSPSWLQNNQSRFLRQWQSVYNAIHLLLSPPVVC